MWVFYQKNLEPKCVLNTSVWFHRLFGKALFRNKEKWSSRGPNRLSSFKILSCQLGNSTKETHVTSGSAKFSAVKSKLGEVGLWAAASVGVDVQLERSRRKPPYHISLFKRSSGHTWTLLEALQLHTAPVYFFVVCQIPPSSPLLWRHNRGPCTAMVEATCGFSTYRLFEQQAASRKHLIKLSQHYQWKWKTK